MPASPPVRPKLSVTVLLLATFLSLKAPAWVRFTASVPNTPLRAPPLTFPVADELVIDPILSYSTYLGGSNIDGANAIAVAPDHTAFVAGGTFSTDFPTAGTHPLQLNHGGPDDFSKDAFVAKLSADGQTVLYATYLGGKNQDFANGIAVDNVGDAYVVGTTLSRLGKTMSPWPPHQPISPTLRPSIENFPVAPSSCKSIS